MLRILSREGARPQVSRFFFKYVVQSVLLFGAETWVVNPCIRRVLGRFPRPGGADTDWNIPQQRLDGKWKYNSEAAAILEVGFELMEPTFGEGRMRLHSILQHDHFWNFSSQQIGIMGHGWACGGRNRQELTW